MATFRARSALLKHLSIQYTQDQEWRGEVGPNRKPHKVEVFQRVRLPLSPIEWMSVCTTEGRHYVGGCCSAMSALQDRISHIFRFDSGWASGRELAAMAQIIIDHGDFETDIPWGTLDKPIEKIAGRAPMGTLDPWSKIALCWHLIDGFYSAEVPHASHPKRTPIERAAHLLGNAMFHLSMCNLFEKDPVMDGPKSQAQANRAVLLARVLPALKLLNENVDQLDLGSVEGWALIDSEKGPDEVASNGFGYCIYVDRKEAETLYQTWLREAAEYEEEERKQHLADHILIRPVRVTKEEGIVFTGAEEPVLPRT